MARSNYNFQFNNRRKWNSLSVEKFQDTIIDFFDAPPDATTNEEVKRMIGLFWHCTSIMPWLLCEYLEIGQGSTYARGVRRLRQIINEE